MQIGGFNDTQNKDLIVSIVDELKLNPVTDAIPKQVIPTIQPVYDVSRKASAWSFENTTTTTGTNIISVPTGKTLYVTSIAISNLTNSTADSTSVVVNATINGQTVALIGLRKITLTSNAQSYSISYPNPIKLDVNTTLSIVNVFTVGSSSTLIFVTGYLE